MADIAQVLATGGTALVSATAGAVLTYWLGALNRRHQEKREDDTRWYETRLKAYAAMPQVVTAYISLQIAPNVEAHKKF
jgi:membrane protein YqaA with SNARE-associated domain